MRSLLPGNDQAHVDTPLVPTLPNRGGDLGLPADEVIFFSYYLAASLKNVSNCLPFDMVVSMDMNVPLVGNGIPAAPEISHKVPEPSLPA